LVLFDLHLVYCLGMLLIICTELVCEENRSVGGDLCVLCGFFFFFSSFGDWNVGFWVIVFDWLVFCMKVRNDISP
jgi:hypothetical protein